MQFQLGMAQNERGETNKENIGFPSSKNEILHLPREKRKEGLNAKGLREKLAKVGLVYEEQTKRLEKAPLQMSPKVKPIAKALLSKKDDDVDFGDIFVLFSDPYFQERVLVSPTKSGCKVIAHDTANKSVLRAGTHKKHGQEKFTGKLHPAFREDLRKTLKAFRLP